MSLNTQTTKLTDLAHKRYQILLEYRTQDLEQPEEIAKQPNAKDKLREQAHRLKKKILEKTRESLTKTEDVSDNLDCRQMSLYERWASDDLYYNGDGNSKKSSTQKQPSQNESIYDRWAADQKYYSSLTPRELDRMLISWQHEEFGQNAFDEARFSKVFIIQSYDKLVQSWPHTLGHEDDLLLKSKHLKPTESAEEYNAKLKPYHYFSDSKETNFDKTVQYLSPIVPRLRLSLSEYALQQHLSLNLSRAGYFHLFNDPYMIRTDPVYHDEIRGYPDPGYVLSRRAKIVFAGTSSAAIPNVKLLNIDSLLHRTIAPRLKNQNLDRDCALCTKPFHNNSKVIILPCTHVFHSECAKDWFVICADWCPVCEYFYRHLRYPSHSCIVDYLTR